MAKKTKASAPELTPVELFAIHHIGKKADSDVRDQLEVGDGQLVDVKLHIHGAINVGADTSYDTTVKPDLVDVVAIALSISPQYAAKLKTALEKAYKGLDAEAKPTIDENLRKHAKELVHHVGREKRVHQRGRVTAALQCDVID